jgi:uncharacterized protein YbjT (DUF2867 family)
MPHSKELSGKPTDPKHVLVTGATGQQGGHVARRLLERGHRVRALTRKSDSPEAGELRKLGAEIVVGDLGDQASVERVARGVDAAFLVATPYEQGVPAEIRFGKTALNGLHAAGVPFVVYSSVSDADRKTGIPHFDSKAEVEAHLRGLGTDHAIVAPVFFMENLLAPWIAAGVAQGVLSTGVLPTHKLQVISLPEIAEFSVLAIEQPGAFRGKRVNIASDEPTFPTVAARLSELTGRKVAYHATPIDEVRKQSADAAAMYDWFNRVGYSVDIPRLKREYPQVHWTTFHEWSGKQDWSAAMRAPS